MNKLGRRSGTTKKVQLSTNDRNTFQQNQKKGKHSARVLRRQRILLLADSGMEPEAIAVKEGVTPNTVYNTYDRYHENGSTEDRPRTGRPEKISGIVKAWVIATACTDAPKGHSRWTLRLLADHIVQLEMLDSISKDSIGRILKKTT